MNKKPNLFNQVIISSIEDYKNKIETLTKQKERLIRRDKKHREEIERLKLIIATAIRIYEKCEETQDYSTCDLDMYEVLKGVHNDR